MNRFSSGVLFVCALALAGCEEEACDEGFAYCDGNTGRTCNSEEQTMEVQRCDEDEHCVVAEGEALCAHDPEPDARCEEREQFCRSSAVLISCRHGYIVGLQECVDLGIASEGWACVSDASQPDGPPMDDCQPTELAE